MGNKIRGWSIWCVQSASMSILVNCSPTIPLTLQKRILQGDPISSFLFTMNGESLNYIIKQAQSRGLVKGIEVGKDRVEITHLEFVDNTLIFLPRDDNVKLNFKRMFDCFGIMTGLTINYRK